MKFRRKKIIKFIHKYSFLCIGLFLYALAFNMFMVPNDFVVGGVSGISIILYKLFSFDTSLTVLILSIFLTIIGFIFCDKDRMYSSVASSFLLPLFIKLTLPISQYFDLDLSLLLSGIYCALIVGVGLGMVYKVGLSTGGTEIIYWILDKYIRKSTGQLMVIVEGIIILIGAVSFGFQKLMYSLIILYIMSNVSDRIVIGISDCKLISVMPKNVDLVKEYIDSLSFVKNVSLITEDNKDVIYCVVHNKDYKIVYDEIKKIDNECFLSVTNTYETMGGF